MAPCAAEHPNGTLRRRRRGRPPGPRGPRTSGRQTPALLGAAARLSRTNPRETGRALASANLDGPGEVRRQDLARSNAMSGPARTQRTAAARPYSPRRRLVRPSPSGWAQGGVTPEGPVEDLGGEVCQAREAWQSWARRGVRGCRARGWATAVVCQGGARLADLADLVGRPLRPGGYGWPGPAEATATPRPGPAGSRASGAEQKYESTLLELAGLRPSSGEPMQSPPDFP
jgi:hypothetical protein